MDSGKTSTTSASISGSIAEYLDQNGFINDDYKVLAMQPEEAFEYFNNELEKGSNFGQLGMQMTHYYTKLSMDSSLSTQEKINLQNELEEKYVALSKKMEGGYLSERNESITRNLIQGMSGSDGYESPYADYISAVLSGNLEEMVNVIESDHAKNVANSNSDNSIDKRKEIERLEELRKENMKSQLFELMKL